MHHYAADILSNMEFLCSVTYAHALMRERWCGDCLDPAALSDSELISHRRFPWDEFQLMQELEPSLWTRMRSYHHTKCRWNCNFCQRVLSSIVRVTQETSLHCITNTHPSILFMQVCDTCLVCSLVRQVSRQQRRQIMVHRAKYLLPRNIPN